MQKNKLIKITLSLVFFLFAISFESIEVKYAQFFADKKIVLTEKHSAIGFLTLPLKKGFVNFEL